MLMHSEIHNISLRIKQKKVHLKKSINKHIQPLQCLFLAKGLLQKFWILLEQYFFQDQPTASRALRTSKRWQKNFKNESVIITWQHQECGTVERSWDQMNLRDVRAAKPSSSKTAISYFTKVQNRR